MATAIAVPRGDVSADLNYYQPPADNSPPFTNVDPVPPQPQRNYSLVAKPTTIRDIRGRESDFSLDRHAFQVIRHVAPSAEPSFTDDASIAALYYPEVEALLLAHVPGAHTVRIFDHTIRRTASADADAHHHHRSPVQIVHIDQTPAAVAQRVRRYFDPQVADALLARRYRVVNVWRPLNHDPVEALPLAFASTRSVADDDVVPVAHRYSGGYTGETAVVRYNPAQEWFYLSGMTGDERLLLECFDSESLRPGSGIGGRTPHSAFVHPRTRVDAEGRESIEVRALVFGQ